MFGKDRDDKPIIQIEANVFNSGAGSREIRERIWYRNILYYMGEQWIEWSKEQRRFEAKWQYGGEQDPRPVSNYILDYNRSVKALILNKDLVYNVWPNSNDHDDMQAAELGGLVLKDMDTRDGSVIIDEQEAAILWMSLTGTGFIRDYPNMGLGKWIGQTGLKTGDIATEAIMPFNVFVGDTPGNTLRKKPSVGIQGLKDTEWIEDTFKMKIGGKKTDTQHGHDYQRSLMEIVGNVSEWKGSDVNSMFRGAGLTASGAKSDVDMTLFREIEIAPTIKYPEGRYIIRAGGKTLLDVPRMPIPVDKDGSWFYTIEDIRHNLIPGGFWGEAGTSSLISPQNTINKIDQDLIKNRDDVAKPTVTGPTGMSFKTVSRNGNSIKVVKYDPIASGGVAPTITRGTALPAQVLNERQIQREVFQDSSGDPKGVLAGKAPSGSSGVMVDILRETAEAGHQPDVTRVFRAFQRSARKRLVIAGELFSEERILKISGSDGKIGVKTFKGADLRDNTDVRLEPATGFSSTNAGKVSTISGLITAGLFNEQVVTVENREEITRLMGLTGFSNKISPDMARAESENTLLSNSEADKVYVEIAAVDPDTDEPLLDPDTGEPVIVPAINDPLFEFDNHEVHFEAHRKFLISPQFKDLEEKDQVIALAHTSVHQKRIELAQLAAQEQEVMLAAEGLTEGQPQPGTE